MKKLTVIDGDSIGYICSKDNIRESLDNVDSIIQTIVDNTKADLYTIALSDAPYFRKAIDPQYKANRKPSALKYLKTIKAYLKEEYRAFSWKLVEADDILGWFNYNMNKQYDITLASIDKDVLQSLPGKGYDYKYHIWVETTREQSEEFFKYQQIRGDTSDNIKGLVGYGDKKTKKFLKEDNSNISIIKLYIDNLGTTNGIAEYFKTRRLVKILQTNADFLAEVDYIPNNMEIFNYFNTVDKIEF